MRAFWAFIRCDNDGDPMFPPGAVDYSATMPHDVFYLDTAAGHKHLLVGGYGIRDDNLNGQTGEGHTHIALNYRGNFQQFTIGAADHSHPITLDANNNPVRKWVLAFVKCSDADALLFVSDGDNYPVAEIEVVEDGEGGHSLGDYVGGWATHDTAWWQAACLDVLEFELDPMISDGERLVATFRGALLARTNVPGAV